MTRVATSTDTFWSRPKGVMERTQRGVALILIAAFASFLLSVILWFAGDRQYGLFVGLWVPSILAAGGFWAVTNGARR
jgi:hypothetical protein